LSKKRCLTSVAMGLGDDLPLLSHERSMTRPFFTSSECSSSTRSRWRCPELPATGVPAPPQASAPETLASGRWALGQRNDAVLDLVVALDTDLEVRERDAVLAIALAQRWTISVLGDLLDGHGAPHAIAVYVPNHQTVELPAIDW
jgi:hypothetical protein